MFFLSHVRLVDEGFSLCIGGFEYIQGHLRGFHHYKGQTAQVDMLNDMVIQGFSDVHWDHYGGKHGQCPGQMIRTVILLPKEFSCWIKH